MFVMASNWQHQCHAYLASLPKYTLPTHPFFNKLVCPHYTFEAAIYLALALMGAPMAGGPAAMQILPLNYTMMCVVVWVIAQLGCVASETKKWSEEKFGKEKMAGKNLIIPGVW